DILRTASVGRFAYRHPLLRAVAYHTIEAGWRLTAHDRSAAVLQQRGAPVLERAYHVERSAAYGDLRAVGVLAEATAASIDTVPVVAGRLAQAALLLLPDNGSAAAQRLGLQAMLGR